MRKQFKSIKTKDKFRLSEEETSLDFTKKNGKEAKCNQAEFSIQLDKEHLVYTFTD